MLLLPAFKILLAFKKEAAAGSGYKIRIVDSKKLKIIFALP